MVLKPTTLSISPALFAIGTQNGTAQLTATVKDQLGNLFLGAALTWSSNDPRVAVSNTGLATGIGTGAQATITATVTGTSVSGTNTVTTPVTTPTTLTITAGFANLAAAANAGGMKTGFSVNPGYESQVNYQQNWAQMAGGGGITTSENFWDGFHIAPTASVSGSTLTINWVWSVIDAQVAKAQFNNIAFKSYLIGVGFGFVAMTPRGNWASGTAYAVGDGAYDTTTSPGRWYVCRIAVSGTVTPSSDFTTFTNGVANTPAAHWRQQNYSPDWLNQLVGLPGMAGTVTATVAMQTYIDGITQHYNTPGSPAAWSSATAYVPGNTVTFIGKKYTCVLANTNQTPGVAFVTWVQTNGLYMHNVCNEPVLGGASNQGPWLAFIGQPEVYVPLMAQRAFLNDPGAKIQFNVENGELASDTAQRNRTLAIASAVIAGGSIGGASNLIVGIEGHTICSKMQVTNGAGALYNQALFTAYLNAILALGCGYAPTEFDVQDDMFEGSGTTTAALAQRDAVIALAYRNYFAGVKAASAKPDHAMVWQLSDLDNWLDINGIGLRSDKLPQRPDLLDLNYVQKPSGLTFLSWLLSYAGSSGSIVLNDALPHQIPASLNDQWGAAMSLSTLAWSSTNTPFIPVSTGGVVQASAGSQSAVITAAANGVTPPLSQSVTVTTAAPVLTSVALAPGNATLASGTLQETATEQDQYNVALSGIGGGVAVFSAGGVATAAASVATIASQAAQLWTKGRILVDSLRALAASTGFGLQAIDSDGAGTNKKFEVYGQTNGSGQVQLIMAPYIAGSVRQLVLGTRFVNLTAFPASGNYVEWFGGVDITNNQTMVGCRDMNGNVINDGTSTTLITGNVVPVFTGTLVTSGIISIGSSTISIQATTLTGTITVGSTFVISGTTYTVGTATTASGQVLHSIPVSPNTVATYASGTAVTAMTGGPLNTTGSNGLVRLNKGHNGIAAAQAITHDGAAVYAGVVLPTTAQQWSKPLAADSGIAAGWYQGDATSGALTTAVSFAGGQQLNYSGTVVGGFSDPNGWSAPAGPSYTWASDNTLAGTVVSGPGTNQGTVSFVAVGSAHITATPTAAPSVSGSALVTFGAGSIPASVTVVPSVATLQGVGSNVQLTPTVLDQFLNVLAAAVSYASSNPAAATVSAGGLVTWAGVGTATITVTVSGTSPVISTTSAITTSAAAVTHEPAGMTPQINTGAMTALPAGLTMLSPATWGAPFQTGQAANLAPVPVGTGLRVTYPSILPGGFSPVRFSFALATPSPQMYVRYLVRYSSNWTNNGNTGTGMFAPQFSGSNNAGNENDLITGRCDNPPAVDQYVVVQQQGQATRTLPAVTTTYAAADPNGNMAGPSRGSWHTVEALFTAQSSTASANGSCTVWMDGTQCFTASNVAWVSGADSPNWATLLCDPTYGGGTNSPPAVSPALHWDFDQLYVSTLGGSQSSNMPAGMTVLVNTGPITAASTHFSVPNTSTGPYNFGGPGPSVVWTVNNSPTGTFGLATASLNPDGSTNTDIQTSGLRSMFPAGALNDPAMGMFTTHTTNGTGNYYIGWKQRWQNRGSFANLLTALHAGDSKAWAPKDNVGGDDLTIQSFLVATIAGVNSPIIGLNFQGSVDGKNVPDNNGVGGAGTIPVTASQVIPGTLANNGAWDFLEVLVQSTGNSATSSVSFFVNGVNVGRCTAVTAATGWTASELYLSRSIYSGTETTTTYSDIDQIVIAVS